MAALETADLAEGSPGFLAEIFLVQGSQPAQLTAMKKMPHLLL